MNPNTKPVILSTSGPVLLPEERALFADFQPLGFIFFGRNIEDKRQLATLCADVREAVGWHCPILIDQEGGRVRRLRPPHWPDYPSMKEIGDSADSDVILTDTIRGISRDLVEVGIDVDCAPVLDVLFPETHDAIGTRAFSHDPDVVSRLGLLACEVFLQEGITPVIKHMPGQGRSALDSHYDLPVVSASLESLELSDFKPFRHIIENPLIDRIWGMVSHIIYDTIDPEHPASTSSKVIDFIRKNLKFNGLLVSDDLCMNALCRYGSPADRVAKTLESGMDIALYCAGQLNEMREIAKACPPMRESSFKRYERSQKL